MCSGATFEIHTTIGDCTDGGKVFEQGGEYLVRHAGGAQQVGGGKDQEGTGESTKLVFRKKKTYHL